jgi:glycosyltransferase involved in cell wall biosynthesis
VSAPLVSAVIPTYNYAHFVTRAIDSVLAQRHAPVECIVVDDGSTDDTRAVLARYGDRIRVIKKANAGLSAARNSGIEAARGDLLATLDADDYWDPDKLDRQVALLQRQPELAAVGCGARFLGPGHPVVAWNAPAPPAERDELLRRIAVRKFMIGGSGSGLLARRSLFADVGGFDVTLRAAEDWDMWLRIAARAAVSNVPQPLTNIWVHATGSFRNPRLMEQNQWRVYEKAVAAWPAVLDARTRRQMRALIFSDAGGEFVTAGDVPEALRYYWRSMLAWPFERPRWRPTLSLTWKRLRQVATGGGGNR